MLEFDARLRDLAAMATVARLPQLAAKTRITR